MTEQILNLLKASAQSLLLFVANSAKALVGSLVVLLVAWLAQRGVTMPTDVVDGLTTFLMWALTYAAIWLVPNKEI